MSPPPPLPLVPNVAIVGATGAVGRELLELMTERVVPHGMLRLLASSRSAGTTLPYCGTEVPVEDADAASFDDVDVVIVSAGGDTARRLAPRALEAGAFVIDNSSAFRMDPAAALVVPEVNPEALPDPAGPPRIVANPNCSTIIALLALTPIHRAFGVQRVVAATYQAASGGGAALVAELEAQARAWAAGEAPPMEVCGRPYVFNVFSHDSPVGPDGTNEEEAKLRRETRRLWNAPDLPVSATCVRVPTRRSHLVALHAWLETEATEDELRAVLEAAPGVTLLDDRAANRFPEPVLAAGGDDVLVGRIRRDPEQDDPGGSGHAVALLACGDQLRKGAALNAIQILEAMLGRAGAGTSASTSETAAGAGPGT